MIPALFRSVPVLLLGGVFFVASAHAKPPKAGPHEKPYFVPHTTFDGLPLHVRLRLEGRIESANGGYHVYLDQRGIDKLNLDNVTKLAATDPTLPKDFAEKYGAAEKKANNGRDEVEKESGRRELDVLKAQIYAHVGPYGLKAALNPKTADGPSLTGKPKTPASNIDITGNRSKAEAAYKELQKLEGNSKILEPLRMRAVDSILEMLDRKVEKGRTPGPETVEFIKGVNDVLEMVSKQHEALASEAARMGTVERKALHEGKAKDLPAEGAREVDLTKEADAMLDGTLAEMQAMVNDADTADSPGMSKDAAKFLADNLLGPNAGTTLKALRRLVKWRKEAEKDAKTRGKTVWDLLSERLDKIDKGLLGRYCAMSPPCFGAKAVCPAKK